MGFDWWHLSTLLTFLAISLFFIRGLVSPWYFRIPWGYFLLYTILTIFFLPVGVYSKLELAIPLGATRWLLTLVLIPIFVANLSSLGLSRLRRYILIFLGAQAVLGLIGVKDIFTGPTHLSCILAIFLPLFWEEFGRFSIPLLPCILWFGGGGAFAVLLVQLSILIVKKGLRLPWLLAGYLVLIPIFWNELKTSERMQVWQPYLDWYSINGNKWIGLGPGSFEWISAEHFGRKFMWIHNDWLQFYFETGVVGLICASCFFGIVAYYLRNSEKSFLVWIGLGVGMLVYSPIQYVPIQILLATIIREAVEEARWRTI